jgi:ureidoglycolate hydrolase
MTEQTTAPTEAAVRWIDLRIDPLTTEAFSPFGTVLAAQADGQPFGPSDAVLDLSRGTPRFYTMRIPGRGLSVQQITRHRQVTQALASAGGQAWVMAVAPPLALDLADAEPALESIRAFRIPGDVAIALHRGTWHAGPLFDTAEASFFNLELADTNVVDHHTCHLTRRYGTALRLID